MANLAFTRAQFPLPPHRPARDIAPRYIVVGRRQTPLGASSGPRDPLLAVMAITSASTLRVLFGGRVDPTHIDVMDRSRYVVTGRHGVIAITGVARHADERSVVLHLDAPFPAGAGSVWIAAGTAKSWPGGSLLLETTLPVQGADQTPPVVSNFVPAPGVEIGIDMPVSFSVTDDTGLGRIIIAVRYDKLGRADVAHDGTTWRDLYEGNVAPLPGGYRYTVHRRGGWPSSPTIQIFAVDAAGNEVAHGSVPGVD